MTEELQAGQRELQVWAPRQSSRALSTSPVRGISLVLTFSCSFRLLRSMEPAICRVRWACCRGWSTLSKVLWQHWDSDALLCPDPMPSVVACAQRRTRLEVRTAARQRQQVRFENVRCSFPPPFCSPSPIEDISLHATSAAYAQWRPPRQAFCRRNPPKNSFRLALIAFYCE